MPGLWEVIRHNQGREPATFLQPSPQRSIRALCLKSSPRTSLAARASQLSHSQLILPIYTCNMAHQNAKYKINHTCEGNATTRRNSLSGRGDLLMSTDHWLSKVLPEEYMFTRGANNVISQHLLEYLFLNDLNSSGPFTGCGRCDPALSYAWSCWGIAPLVSVFILWVSVSTTGGNSDQTCRFTPHIVLFTPIGAVSGAK